MCFDLSSWEQEGSKASTNGATLCWGIICCNHAHLAGWKCTGYSGAPAQHQSLRHSHMTNYSLSPNLFFFFLSSQLGTYNTFDEYAEGVYCPIYSGFFGVMGATAAMIFSGESQSFFSSSALCLSSLSIPPLLPPFPTVAVFCCFQTAPPAFRLIVHINVEHDSDYFSLSFSLFLWSNN